MLWLRSLLFNCCYGLWTAGAHVAALVPFFFGNRAGIAAVAFVWVRGTLFLLRVLCGLGFRELGTEHLPKGQAVIASKHQSAWETLFLTRRFDFPAYVLKRELLALPLFGAFLRAAGMIAIDRAAGPSALKQMLRELRATLGHGRNVVIFPEGTRVAPGKRHKYHSGIAAIYAVLGLPVVPVALNSGLFWGRRAFLKRPGTITIQYLPAIPPGLERKTFMAELERRIETASDALLKQPRAGG